MKRAAAAMTVAGEGRRLSRRARIIVPPCEVPQRRETSSRGSALQGRFVSVPAELERDELDPQRFRGGVPRYTSQIGIAIQLKPEKETGELPGSAYFGTSAAAAAIRSESAPSSTRRTSTDPLRAFGILAAQPLLTRGHGRPNLERAG